MKMELVQEALQAWGELLVTTSTGERYEFHLGDTEFDVNRRLIVINAPTARFLINGDDVQSIEQHYGQRIES